MLQAVLETVVRISSKNKGKDDDDGDAGDSSNSSDASGDGGSSPDSTALPHFEQEVDRIIDSHDNVFVLSASKDGAASLTLDPQLIQDLTFILATAAVSTADCFGHVKIFPGSCPLRLSLLAMSILAVTCNVLSTGQSSSLHGICMLFSSPYAQPPAPDRARGAWSEVLSGWRLGTGHKAGESAATNIGKVLGTT